jgi:hypothetical protein
MSVDGTRPGLVRGEGGALLLLLLLLTETDFDTEAELDAGAYPSHFRPVDVHRRHAGFSSSHLTCVRSLDWESKKHT